MKDVKNMVLATLDALEDKKAENIEIIDISQVSPIADYFIIANGNSKNQVQAITNNVEEKLGRLGYDRNPIEGYEQAGWILMDYHDVIIHVFDKESRQYYDLSRIWRDGKIMSAEEFRNK